MCSSSFLLQISEWGIRFESSAMHWDSLPNMAVQRLAVQICVPFNNTLPSLADSHLGWGDDPERWLGGLFQNASPTLPGRSKGKQEILCQDN
jgi:hypothetical protein